MLREEDLTGAWSVGVWAGRLGIEFEGWPRTGRATRSLSWFAQAGTLVMVPEPGRPYFFYSRDDWGRHPHYGRFLEARENQLVEMTWMTGNGTAEGTEGAETVLRFELVPQDGATEVHLTHSGFVSETSRAGHEENWPLALEVLNDALAAE